MSCDWGGGISFAFRFGFFYFPNVFPPFPNPPRHLDQQLPTKNYQSGLAAYQLGALGNHSWFYFFPFFNGCFSVHYLTGADVLLLKLFKTLSITCFAFSVELESLTFWKQSVFWLVRFWFFSFVACFCVTE